MAAAAYVSGGSNLPGSATNYNPIYGGKPNVPNPTSTANAAISGNLGNWSGLYQLGSNINTANQNQLLQNLNLGLPNYNEMTQKASQNIGNELAGQVPQDVVNQIIQSAAERGIATGTTGSPNENTALLRALGLTSLNLQQQGNQDLSAAVARTPQAPLFNYSSMLTTPEEQQQAEMAANLYASAPNPMQSALNAEAVATGPNIVPKGPFTPMLAGAGGVSYGSNLNPNGPYYDPSAAGVWNFPEASNPMLIASGPTSAPGAGGQSESSPLWSDTGSWLGATSAAGSNPSTWDTAGVGLGDMFGDVFGVPSGG